MVHAMDFPSAIEEIRSAHEEFPRIGARCNITLSLPLSLFIGELLSSREWVLWYKKLICFFTRKVLVWMMMLITIMEPLHKLISGLY